MSSGNSTNNLNHLEQVIPVPGNKKLWWLRRLILGGVVLCGLLIIFVIMLPTMLGSRWVYQPLLDRLETGNFKLQVDTVRLRWFSPLELGKVTVYELDGSPLVTISHVRTDRGLIAYLLGGRRIGRIEFIDPSIDIELVTDETNLGRLIDAVDGKLGGKDTSQPKSTPAIDVDVVLRGFTATVKRSEQAEPLVVIPAFDLDLAYRAVAGDSHVSLQPTKLLDHVQMTPELMKLGLGYAIPLLAESAWFDGHISLSTGAIDIPLNDPKSSTGDAVITLHQVRSGPSEPVIINALDLIAKLRNREPHHELVFVDGSEVEVRVADRKVHHQGLQFGLPKVDTRLQMSTSGAVGLGDRSLDLTLEFPVPIEQLARRDAVKELGVPMVKLPIVGTLDEPKIEWTFLRRDSADLLSVMRDKVQEESPATAAILGGLEGLADGKADQAIAAATDFLQELRNRREAKLKQQAADEKTTSAETSEKISEKTEDRKSQPIRDALRDLLKKKK